MSDRTQEGNDVVREVVAAARRSHLSMSKGGYGVSDYCRGMFIGEIITAQCHLDADNELCTKAVAEINAMRDPAQVQA